MKLIKQLEKLVLADKKKRHPEVPEYALVKPSYTDATANGLTKAILAWLELNGHKAWRQASEGRYRPGETITDVLGHVRQMKGKYIPGTNEGHSDVCAIIDGRFCAIEVKMKDSQSEKQKKYQREVEASGGLYKIVHNFDEFMQWYKNVATHDLQSRVNSA